MQRVRLIVFSMISLAGLAAFNVVAFGLDSRYRAWQLDRKLSSREYTSANGRWTQVDVRPKERLRTIHMVLLRTGKVLMIAGSGNSTKRFESGRFSAGLFNPATGRTKLIPMPEDIFCAGQTTLEDGSILFAGGTERYEVLAPDITHASGVMAVHNESPDGEPFDLPVGTVFVSSSGSRYRSTRALRIRPADKDVRPGGRTSVTASVNEVRVTAIEAGEEPVGDEPAQYAIEGLSPARSHNLYGLSEGITLDKQEFAGARFAYVFDPDGESFRKVSDMNDARWYPSLISLEDGRALAVSGLDEFGRILPGTNEIYDPATDRWTLLPRRRTFPTYPAMFTTVTRDTLLYTGGSAGYGSDVIGRDPGLWDWRTDAFTEIPGLRDATMTETSASVRLAPANDRRFAILGGGGIGESSDTTARVDVVDLREDAPRFRPGPSLPRAVRYPSAVVLPDDSVLVTGGSSDYRAKGDSNALVASLLEDSGRTLRRVADPTIGRTYHSSALLLPDGRVLTSGGDPLYNSSGTGAGTFQTGLEIYSPPYLFTDGTRPVIKDAPAAARRGGTIAVATARADTIAAARLIHPGAVTHTTDLDQRSVALGLEVADGALRLSLPDNPGLLPSGWYMLFLTDREGVPSKARWIRITGA